MNKTKFLILVLVLLIASPVFAQPTLEEVEEIIPDTLVQKVKNFFVFLWNGFIELLKAVGEIFVLVFDVAADLLEKMLELPIFQKAYE